MECGNDVEDDDTDDYTVNDDFDTGTDIIKHPRHSSTTGKITKKVTETKKSADTLNIRNSLRLRQSSKKGPKKSSSNKNNPILHNIRTRGSIKVNLSEIKDSSKRSRGQIKDKVPKSLTSCVVKLENLSEGTLKNGEGVDKICENLSVSKKRRRSKDGIEKSLSDTENELQATDSCTRKTAVNKKDQISTQPNGNADMVSTRTRKTAVDKQEPIKTIHNEVKDLNQYLNRKEYICGVCSNESSNAFSYFNHVKNHRNYQLCKVCDVMVPSNNETIEKHRKEFHKDDLFFKCPKCNKEFKSKLQLKTHFPSHNSNVKYLERLSDTASSKVKVMSKEQERFTKMHPDLQEINKYLNRTEYACSLCSNVYNNSVSYYNHIRSHKDHQLCKVCDTMIPCGAGKMEKHRKEIHGDDFCFKCPDCDKKYKSKLGLKTHFILHHADQSVRFNCKICKASYGNASMLKRHEKIHTFDHSCFICQEKIETNLKLKEHMLEAHSFHFCVTCSLYFVDSLELEEHEQTHFNNSNSSDDDDDEPATNSTSFEESSSCMPLLEKENVSSEMEPVENASNHRNIQEVDVDKEKMSTEAEVTDAIESLIIDLTPELSEVTSDMPDISVDEIDTADHEISQIRQKFNENLDKKCKFCGKRFKHGNALDRHVKLHNNKANFTCVHCGQVCKTDETYKRHLLVHLPNAEKPQHCEKCGKGFATYSALKIHSYTHFDKNHFMCEFCGKGYRDPKMLKIHRRKHTGEYPYHCAICDKKFRSWDLLAMHKITHKSDPDVICDVCGKTFSHRIRLAAHRKRHTDEKKHKCTLCVKVFKNPYNLQQHCISMHIEYAKSRGWKMHECKDCNRLIATKERFRRHVRTHTGERPFGCEICGKRFAEKGNLNSHMKIHNDDKQFECIYCSKRFIHNRTLKKHLLIHEKPIPENTLVNRSGYTPDELLAISIVADSNNYVLQNNPSIPLAGQQTVTETRSYNLELNKNLEQKTHASVQSEDKLVFQQAQQVDIPVEAIQSNDSDWRDKIRLMYN
ncbi:uncharacterized protein LOC143052136 [Mytilus galloprovincialis]|uniref:uncharacterized protein LOC143052136 n=1 Tax=Mytilus galloprovincialis TaxID=29158 RepID=UPI003F7C20BF